MATTTDKVKLARPGVRSRPATKSKTIGDTMRGVRDMLGDTATGIAIFIVGIFVTAIMAQVAVFVFSKPGLVEWVAQEVFVQNCVRNGVCDFNQNMAAFAVANVFGFCFVAAVAILLLNSVRSDEEVMDETLTRIENTATYTAGRIEALESALEQREVIRKDIPANS